MDLLQLPLNFFLPSQKHWEHLHRRAKKWLFSEKWWTENNSTTTTTTVSNTTKPEMDQIELRVTHRMAPSHPLRLGHGALVPRYSFLRLTVCHFLLQSRRRSLRPFFYQPAVLAKPFNATLLGLHCMTFKPWRKKAKKKAKGKKDGEQVEMKFHLMVVGWFGKDQWEGSYEERVTRTQAGSLLVKKVSMMIRDVLTLLQYYPMCACKQVSSQV